MMGKKTEKIRIQPVMYKQQYMKLIQLCRRECNAFSFWIPDLNLEDMDDESKQEYNSFMEKVSPVLKKLEPFLIRLENTRAYINRHSDEKRIVFYYTLEADDFYTVEDLLFNMVESIYDWYYPHFFEDVVFYKDDVCWLLSTAHEEECFIYDNSGLIKNELKWIGFKTIVMHGNPPKPLMSKQQYIDLMNFFISKSDSFSVSVPFPVLDFNEREYEDLEELEASKKVVEEMKEQFEDFNRSIKPFLDKYEKNMICEKNEERVVNFFDKRLCKTYYYCTEGITLDSITFVDGLTDWYYPNFFNTLCFYNKGKCWMQLVPRGFCFVYAKKKELAQKFQWFEFLPKKREFPVPKLPKEIKNAKLQ